MRSVRIELEQTADRLASACDELRRQRSGPATSERVRTTIRHRERSSRCPELPPASLVNPRVQTLQILVGALQAEDPEHGLAVGLRILAGLVVSIR